MKTPNIKLLKNEQYINHIDFWHSIIKIQYISNHLKPKNFKECKFGHSWINESKSPIYSTVILVKNWKLRVSCSLFHFFHVICKILNFDMWTAKHLVQASCTELTLTAQTIFSLFRLIKWQQLAFLYLTIGQRSPTFIVRCSDTSWVFWQPPYPVR